MYFASEDTHDVYLNFQPSTTSRYPNDFESALVKQVSLRRVNFDIINYMLRFITQIPCVCAWRGPIWASWTLKG